MFRSLGYQRHFTPDPVSFAVIKSALDAIVDEMAGTVMRTARSPIVRDVLDYSATLCDSKGQILSQAKTVALHLGAVPDAMEVIVDRFAASAREHTACVTSSSTAPSQSSSSRSQRSTAVGNRGQPASSQSPSRAGLGGLAAHEVS